MVPGAHKVIVQYRKYGRIHSFCSLPKSIAVSGGQSMLPPSKMATQDYSIDIAAKVHMLLVCELVWLFN